MNKDDLGIACDKLTDIIDDEGMGYISREPYEVYERLVEERIDESISRCVLVLLLAGIVDVVQSVDGEIDVPELSRWIQLDCYYTKNVADDLAGMFLMAFSDDNMVRWNDEIEEGFRIF